jgi:hypothetical protein
MRFCFVLFNGFIRALKSIQKGDCIFAALRKNPFATVVDEASTLPSLPGRHEKETR